MVLRIVLIAVVVFVLLAWLRGLRRGGKAATAQRPAADSQRMVQCAHCAIHLPQTDALADGTRHYCCAEHREAARRAGGQG